MKCCMSAKTDEPRRRLSSAGGRALHITPRTTAGQVGIVGVKTHESHPNGWRRASVCGLDVSNRQQQCWPCKHSVVIFSLTGPKLALVHNATAASGKVEIPAKLLVSQRSRQSDERVIEVSALRKMHIIVSISAEPFLTFTEPATPQLRISCFMVMADCS
jgi:hypothetical protein